jgi:hypothetical protein
VEGRLQSMQIDNAKQLEQMRQTVDEKLQGTLEKRLGESFKQVSERLEMVHKGLGEMQTLAAGVGDLKKVLIPSCIQDDINVMVTPIQMERGDRLCREQLLLVRMLWKEQEIF